MTNFGKIKAMTIDEIAAFLEKSGFTISIRLLDDFVCRDQKLIKEWLEGETKQ